MEANQVIHDRFKILEKLGSGGMASVYKAFDSQLSNTVALKFLNSDQVGSAAKVERFKAEFQILSNLNHPHIAKVYEFIKTESNEVFYSMELLQGTSLAEKITRALTESNSQVFSTTGELVEVLLQVAKALEYIHQNKIIYCDLKPANILLLDQPDVLVKLIDFGIAKVQEGNQMAATKVAMVGTSYYMSPEQIRSEELDVRSDIYSFGVLAFELSTGKPPFNDPSLFSITASHLIGKIPSAKILNHDLPASFDRMIKVCMEKEKADRYDSMQEIIERLSEMRGAPKRKSILSQLFSILERGRPAR